MYDENYSLEVIKWIAVFVSHMGYVGNSCNIERIVFDQATFYWCYFHHILLRQMYVDGNDDDDNDNVDNVRTSSTSSIAWMK